MAIECFAQQADGYDLLQLHDSVISIKERAAEMFKTIGRDDRAAQTIGSTITSLIETGNLSKAGLYCRIYEQGAGIYNDTISEGREIYYYTKGCYYLANHQLDSADYYFRKELRDGKDLNNQIAGCKGLQAVYEQRRIPDSIAKYANLGYELNDSAYSKSEMQNIQKLQASYNYNHHKLLAEQSEKKAQRSLCVLIIIIALIIILTLIVYFQFETYRKAKKAEILKYQRDLQMLEKLQTELQDICSEEKLSPAEIFEIKHKEIEAILNRLTEYKRKAKQPLANLEERLSNAPVVKRLKNYVRSNPYQKASQADFAELKGLVNEEIPHFYTALNP